MLKNHFDKRKFRIWKYSVSLNTLLLRSVEDLNTTIDILFYGVKSMNIESTMTITGINEKIHSEFSEFIINTPNGIMTIKAISCKVVESELSYDDLNGYFNHML
ncbi:hypothetical protein [Listeria sp. ILCC797]|uniref:hypothetical protein n=1 Tax=Listeria sp. ILCC797 TaxID=1918333 RepID=UPI000B590D5D|nr:hypothetical protein [Listeria sp. ILCC797]